ncbi:MAG: hypothetical protein LBO05_13115 [Deltaproteobacteria bacterium]|jgi:exopolyphosphatase/guanosine-5'-triphosphate,3'-diphosphate pyrophosphatase|nr:hypothetical protein [Deltaproteobacteria bacterium]
MPSDCLAALDLGSNTFRLILATPAGGKPASRQVWQELPRLSEGLSPGSPLGEEPKKRALAALEGFAEVVGKHEPKRVLAGGTMVFREASDGRAFLGGIGRRLGWETIVLSGEQEARLSAAGVLSGLDPLPDEAVIFDIGGRSTEFVRTRGRGIVSCQSLPVGVVGLTEAHLKSDPPTPGETRALDAACLRALGECRVDRGGEFVLVGTAGTVTTIEAMLLGLEVYDPELVNNRLFTREDLESLREKVAGTTLASRRSLAGLHPARADVIVAGLALVGAAMSFMDRSRVVVSDNSLLEGLWLAAAGLAHL